MPGPAAHAVATWAAVERLRRRASAAACRCGRRASRTAGGWRRWRRPRARSSPPGLVYLGYPLHPPGDPAKARVAHLPDVRAAAAVRRGHERPVHRPARAARGGRRELPGRDDRVDRGRRSLVRGEGRQAPRRRDRRGRSPPLVADVDARPRLSLAPSGVSDRRRSPACRAGSPRPTASPVDASRPTAETRPSDQSPARVTAWPRRSSPAMTSSPRRSSTTAPAGSHVRGQNESTSAVVCRAGASIACCGE